MSKFHQGKFKPKYIKKYIGDIDTITFRSSWEKKMFIFCDTNTSVIKWGSEIKAIPYYSTIDSKTRRYFPDLWLQYKDKDTGEITNDCIEIKPHRETQPPKKGGGKNKGNSYETYL